MEPAFDPQAVLDGLVDPAAVLNRAAQLVYANREFQRLGGFSDSPFVGKHLADVWPALGGIVEDARYLYALARGERIRFTPVGAAALLRCETVVQPLGNGCVSLILREVRDPVTPCADHAAWRIDAEEHPFAALHARMLAHIGECLRAELGAAEIFFQVACIVGQLPKVSRATFGTVDHESRSITIHRDFCRDIPSMAGVYPMSDAEITSQELGAGRIVIITDVRTDYRSRDAVERRLKLSYLSCVAVPLMRDGRWAATLMVQSPIPRTWLPEEVELIRTAAEQTWLAVENVRLLQEARQANAAKDQFLAMLSHELRTPLTPVVMMLTALQSSDRVADEVKRDLAMIRRNIDLETRLIDDLLDITRIVNGKLRLTLRPTRVHELVEHVCQICAADARNCGIEMTCQLGAGCDVVEADAARLEQVFWNLVKNAIKFTPAGGCVRIVSRDGERELLVGVEDTGAGIAPEVLPRIFNVFEQGEKNVTRSFGGLGLGLAISKAIVDLHGGRIWARSEGVGRGAALHVALPLHVPATQKIGATDPASRPRDGGWEAGSLRVLLVDDHPDTLEIMQRILRSWGLQVTTASGIEAALRAASNATFDLMISDIGLPDGSGCELITQMRKSQPFPAIAVSGFGMETDIQRSLDAGFAAHLTKPVSLEELERLIAELTQP